jgi:hypothetical protein
VSCPLACLPPFFTSFTVYPDSLAPHRQVYTQNLWSFLDVTFAVIFWIYLVLRIQGWRTDSNDTDQQALDVLAMGAPVLIPRLAFNLLSNNLLFVSLRAMMADFTTLTALAAWCFAGFLMSLIWLGDGDHSTITVSKWLLWIWFGLDGTGIQKAPEFHQILGPCLMVTFAFLGNTLFLTILVSMLSNTFSTIVSNATAEIQYRHAVQTLEGVKSDAIFAYQPPFNILALFVLVPLKFVVSPRWFHKIHVAAVRLLNLPLLLIIAAVERRVLWPVSASTKRPGADSGADNRYHWFWEKWRITTHGDIHAVFGLSPPNEVEDAISVDDDLTRHMIRRQFQRNTTADSTNPQNMIKQFKTKQAHERDINIGTGTRDACDQLGATPAASDGRQTPKSPAPGKVLCRRDSMTPFPGLRQELQGIFNDSEEMSDLTSRLEALEDSNARIEAMLARLVGDVEDTTSIMEESHKLGTLDDLDRTADEH